MGGSHSFKGKEDLKKQKPKLSQPTKALFWGVSMNLGNTDFII